MCCLSICRSFPFGREALEATSGLQRLLWERFDLTPANIFHHCWHRPNPQWSWHLNHLCAWHGNQTRWVRIWRDFIWTQPKKPKPCLHNDQLFHSCKCEVHHVTKTCFCYCFALQQWLRLTHISLILHKTRLAKVIFEDFTKWSVLIEIGDWFRWENGKKLKNENL